MLGTYVCILIMGKTSVSKSNKRRKTEEKHRRKARTKEEEKNLRSAPKICKSTRISQQTPLITTSV